MAEERFVLHGGVVENVAFDSDVLSSKLADLGFLMSEMSSEISRHFMNSYTNNALANVSNYVDYSPKEPQLELSDLRTEQRKRADSARVQNRVNYSSTKQNKESVDYIGKHSDSRKYIKIEDRNPSIIDMTAKKPQIVEKDYTQVANIFYPEMSEKSQIQAPKKKTYSLAEPVVLNDEQPIIIQVPQSAMYKNGFIGQMPLAKEYDLTNYNYDKKEDKDYQEIADIFYPTMNGKAENGEMTGGAAPLNKTKDADIVTSLLKISQTQQDVNFLLALAFCYPNEGGYVNHKNDFGGSTNFGVTQSTYNSYAKRYNLPKKDVKNLKKEETIQIYYNDYWKKSGANKANNLIEAIVLLDTAIQHGNEKAKKFYAKSGGNLKKMVELRRQHFVNKAAKDSSQKSFSRGWDNRMNRLENLVKRAYEVGILE